MMNLRELFDHRQGRTRWFLAAFSFLASVGIGTPTEAQSLFAPKGPAPVEISDGAPLSPAVQQQLALIQMDKNSWSARQRKMASLLIYAARVDQGQPAVPGGGPTPQFTLLKRDMVGRVEVDIRGKITPELVQAVQQMGGEVIYAYPKWNSLRAWVGTPWMEQLAGRPDVRTIRPASRPIQNVGSVLSQGVGAHLATTAHQYGVTGGSSTIGVISDSADYLANSVASGDLPNNVNVLIDRPNQAGEGTAMMEIVHDMAPDAALAFATGTFGQAQFAQAILDLAAAGCNVIVDDLRYTDEYPFQDGIIAQAVEEVAAQGVTYFSAAGNQRSSVWEGDYVDGGAAGSPVTSVEAGRLHRFPSGRTYDTATSSDAFYTILSWADPGLASTNDYDVIILDSTGTSIFNWSNDVQDGTQDPQEIAITFPNQRIVVVNKAGKAKPRALRLQGISTKSFTVTMSERTTGEIFGHAAAQGAFGIAAIDATLASPLDFSTLTLANLKTETFSDQGPRRIFYYPDGTPITPGNFLFSTKGGIVRNKPNFTAADGVATSVPNFAPFFGTSAAAPHAAAMYAQMYSLNYFTASGSNIAYAAFLTPEEIWTTFNATILDADAAGVDEKAGGGILMIGQAVDGLVNFVKNLTTSVAGNTVTFSWTTLLPSDTYIELSKGPSDTNPTVFYDPTPTTVHLVTFNTLDGGEAYQYLVSSGIESGSVFNQRSGQFVTELVNPTQAVLLNKTASIWQLQVTLSNIASNTATNVKIDGVVLNATNTTTPLPVTIGTIAGSSSTNIIFKFNRMKLLGLLNVRVTGSYLSSTGTRRFSKVLAVQIL